MCIYTRIATCLKKEVRQVNQKFFEFNIGIANMHRQDGDPGVTYWLGDGVIFVGSHTNTSPILSHT